MYPCNCSWSRTTPSWPAHCVVGSTLEGYSVDVARTGDEGLSHGGRTTSTTAVVLDLMLPGIDGFTVCEELRRRERWAPVLMLTARTEVGDRIRGLDGGADDYLVKPFDFGELLARLRVLVRRGPSANARVLRDRRPAHRLHDPARVARRATRSS